MEYVHQQSAYKMFVWVNFREVLHSGSTVLKMSTVYIEEDEMLLYSQ